MEYQVNQALKLPFTSAGLATGQTSFGTIVTLNGNVITLSPVATYTEVGSGLYTMNFIPTQTGKWAIFLGGAVQLRFDVVTRTTASILADITDESLGSWTWNKSSGLLTLLRGDGSTLATYTVLDTVEASSRERLT